MTQTALSHDILKNHIKQDILACTQLLHLLNDERQALKSRDLEKLEEIIQSKAANLQHLEHSARQRSSWVGRNTEADGTPEQAWLVLLRQNPPPLEDQWQQFKALLQQCQDQNEINGKLLARNQQVFSRLLSIVRGQDANAPVYTPKGGRGVGHSVQKLGEA